MTTKEIREPKHVLIVEDSVEDRQVYIRTLLKHTDMTFTVSEADSGAEILERCHADHPDCVLLDYALPDVDGTECLEIVRSEYNDWELPVVMLTGRGSEQIAVEALKRGAQDYLVKSDLTPTALIRTVTGALERAKLEEQVARQTVELTEANEKLSKAYNDLVDTQAQLVQSAKLASVGQLATGVAHEINQPLSIVSMAASLRLNDIRAGRFDNVKDSLEQILEAVDRASGIIDHLKLFARANDRASRRDFEINEVIESSLALLSRQLELDGVSVEVDAADSLPVLDGNPNQMLQVLTNLILNARDAMEQSETRRLVIRSSRAQPDGVVVEVADTGQGIAPADLDRVFEPFFTGKPVGKGTGLGLSVSYGIIDAHGGKFEVRSELGTGTTFSFALPGKTEGAR